MRNDLLAFVATIPVTVELFDKQILIYALNIAVVAAVRLLIERYLPKKAKILKTKKQKTINQ